MIINAFTSVGKPYTETRNVAIALSSLIGLILIGSGQNYVFVLYLLLFVGGIAVGVYVLQRYVTPPSFWIFGYLLKLRYNPYDISPVPTIKYVQCPVCDKHNCQRHEVQIKSHHIWNGIMLSKKVDEKIAEFCELLIVHYILTWYHPISRNSEFLHEIRCIFRFIVAALIRITMQLDFGKIVTEKMIPLTVLHLDKYVKTKIKHPHITDVEELANFTLEEYGEDLHIALTSDDNENRYLRSLTELLVPHLLPENRSSAPKANCFIRELVAMVMIKTGVDLLADPDFVNLLFKMLLDPESIKEHAVPPSEKVELLSDFVESTSALQSSQYFSLEDLLSSQTNLYSFMQYLRKQGAINLLQCYLTVKEKNDSLNSSPIDSEIKFTAFKNGVREFYDLYFSPVSHDAIEFPSDISAQLRSSLFTNYKFGGDPFRPVLERVCSYLVEYIRSNYCVGFYQSDYFFMLLLGDRSGSSPKLSSWSKPELKRSESWTEHMRRQNIGGIGAMFSSLKDKLSTSPLDPMLEMLDEGAAAQLAHLTASTSGFLGTDDEEEQIDYNEESNLDLSRWSVKVTNYELLGEWLRQYVAYVIDVCTDVEKPNGMGYEQMRVRRRFSEFVMLHKRLRKFHGSLHGLQLPEKKSMNALNTDFIICRKQELGVYLMKLINIDVLKHSELVAKFLSPACDDFNKVTFMSMPGQAIGSAAELGNKMMSGVRPKEKSLELFPFLKSLCKSVTPGYCGSSQGTHSEISSNPTTPVSTPTLQRKTEHLFSTNEVQHAKDLQERVKIELEKRRSHSNSIYMQLTGVSECLLYTLLLLGRLPNIVIHAVCSLLLVIKNTLDHYVITYINFKMKLILQEKEIIEIIELARDVLFFDNEVRGPAEIKERADTAKYELLNKIPGSVKKILGRERVDEALMSIYNGVQHKKLNTQLVYTLLDILLGEILSEFKEKDDIWVQHDGQDSSEETVHTPE